jgi:ankyrin repeat protein
MENNDGYLPLQTAIIGGNLEIVKYMIENLNADIHSKKKAGISPLQLAKMNDLENIVNYLKNNSL